MVKETENFNSECFSMEISSKAILVFFILISIFTSQVLCEAESEANECEAETGDCIDKPAALRLKIIAIISILATSMIGVCLPLFTTKIPSLKPDGNIFVVVKSFASGIIFGTGMMHVLPDAVEQMTSSCLSEYSWHIYPVADYIAGISALLTLTIDALTNSLMSKRQHKEENSEGRRNGGDLEARTATTVEVKGSHLHTHTNLEQLEKDTESSQLLRYRVIAMVLEVGIVVHSVVIGLSLGASNNKCTIRPLIAALCFHQMFEGMGLGGSILQAQYKMLKRGIMVFFFSVTTPFGIVIGLALSKIYRENSPTALITVGTFDAISAGLLIYMALVELLGADFMGRKLQSSIKLILLSAVAAMLGFTGMAILAKWA